MEKLQETNNQLQEQIDTNFEKQIHSLLGDIFTPGQIKALINPTMRMNSWTPEDIANAISIRCASPKMYRYMKEVMKIPLPGLSTLRKWTSKIEVNPGCLECVFNCMQVKGKNLNELEKLVVLTCDEVYLDNRIEIDRKLQQKVGPHKACQCVMVRALFSNWKQLIYYQYDENLSKNTVMEIISKLYRIDYKVVALVSDLGPGNRKLWTELGIGIPPLRTFFQHPQHEDSSIFVFADAPHLIKLGRNHFIDQGFNWEGKIADSKCLEELLTLNPKDLKITYKITPLHLQVQGADRQKVHLATKLFSNNVADSLVWCGEKGYLKNEHWKETSFVLKLINDWFDVFNSKSKYGLHPGTNGYGINLTEQMQLLDRMQTFVEAMRIGTHKSLLPFQKGMIVSIASLKGLYHHLRSKYNNPSMTFEYLITSRLNQDVLENFFSFIRSSSGAYDHPSALDFKYRVRRYILGRQSKIMLSNNSNVVDDSPSTSSLVTPTNNDCFISDMIEPFVMDNSNDTGNDDHEEMAIFNVYDNDDNNNDDPNYYQPIEEMDLLDEENGTCVIEYKPTDEEEELLSKFEQMERIHRIETQGLQYIAGYVAHRFKMKYPHLGNPTCATQNVQNPRENWIQFISRGGLLEPSEEMVRIATHINQEFLNFHQDDLRTEKFIFTKLLQIVRATIHTSIPDEVILCLIRTRTYMRVRALNIKIMLKNREQKQKRKAPLNKFTNKKKLK